MTKVVIGHAGDSNDLDYLMALADTGAILGMDRFGLDVYNPTADRVDTIVALAERGYADRMVLSHDASCFIDWFGPNWCRCATRSLRTGTSSTSPTTSSPSCADRGVTEAQIDQMLVENPGATSRAATGHEDRKNR